LERQTTIKITKTVKTTTTNTTTTTTKHTHKKDIKITKTRMFQKVCLEFVKKLVPK
jgi:hypothetical protein